jgi:hypothetical protein
MAGGFRILFGDMTKQKIAYNIIDMFLSLFPKMTKGAAMNKVQGIHQILKYRLLILAISIFLSSQVSGQRWKLRRYEVGFGIGTTQVFGDIGGAATSNTWYGLKDIKIDETKMAFGLLGRYKIDQKYSIKVNGILGFGGGTDAGSRNVRGRSYKTTLGELSAQLEYYFISEGGRFSSAAMFSRRGMINDYASFNAYGFIGLGALYYSPKFTSTQPLNESVDITTGYSKFTAVFPFGIGLKYIIDDHWLTNAELGYRLTTSDFIDGYTQSASSKHNDVYYFLTISVSYRLKTSRSGTPTILDRLFGKPTSTVKPNKSTKKPHSEKEAKEQKL